MTTAQRARLVVAMGLLNLILATVALTAGFVAPPRPSDQIAVGSPAPTIEPGPSATGPAATTPVPSATPATSGEPAPSVAVPPVEPSATPSPSTNPPGAGPVVAVIPTPSPEPTGAVANPTAAPTGGTPAVPTARPTVRPTATPQPAVSRVHKARPPCPDGTSGPPGHRKLTPPPDRPCGAGSGQGNGSSRSGVVVVLPLVIGGLAAALRTRLVRGSGNPVRGLRSKVTRRKERTAADS